MKKKFILILILVTIFKNINNYINNIVSELNGVYKIISSLNNNYLKYKKFSLKLMNDHTNFRLVLLKSKEYFIEAIFNNKRLGVDNKDNIKLFNPLEENKEKTIWNIIKFDENHFLILNKYNRKFLEAKNDEIICKHNFGIAKTTQIPKNFFFSFLKLYEEKKFIKKNLQNILNEQIDIVIKYIDLQDKNLSRFGIKQIYKDNDNQELKFSIRSILNYIPWIRKIHIIMPNNKVKFFKFYEEIKYKINYIKDRDILGFDSANIFSFTFNFYKLEKLGVSKNFIYMEDDFFIGKPLKKSDFFYFDEREKRVCPFLLNRYFNEMNKSEVLNNYNELYKIKNSLFPHSRLGWWLSIFCTNKYFIERFKIPLIDALFTHNAIPENIDDLKEIFNEIKYYEYINETLLSKERFILTLNQPQFYNLYQLNIKHKKVNPIQYKYINIELIKKEALNTALFVINTSGNHIPLTRQYKIQKKIMEKRFPYKTIFEIENFNRKINNQLKIAYFFLLKIFIIITLIKLI